MIENNGRVGIYSQNQIEGLRALGASVEPIGQQYFDSNGKKITMKLSPGETRTIVYLPATISTFEQLRHALADYRREQQERSFIIEIPSLATQGQALHS